MNNIVPYDFEPPAADELSGVPTQNERFSLRYIVGVILSRRLAGVGVGLLLFLLVIGIVSQIPRTYFAEGAVLIQPRRTNLTRVEQPDQVLPPDTSAIDTEVEMLRSRSLAEEVVRRLKLYDDPEFNSALVADGASSLLLGLADRILERSFRSRGATLWPFRSEPATPEDADNSIWIDRTVMAFRATRSFAAWA